MKVSLKQTVIAMYNSVVLFLLLGLLRETLARSFERNTHGVKDTVKRCYCHLEDIDTGHVIYNHGEIGSFELEDESCHDAHRECRAACREKLNLNGIDKTGGPRRGYAYCDSYGQVTPPRGPVTLQAVWSVAPCRRAHEEDSIRTASLCCGHTFINVNHADTLKVFGWNPDCVSQRFVLGKTRH